MLNLNEAIADIKRVGNDNVRYVPMPGQSTQGLYQIEIKDPMWRPIVKSITQPAAEDIVRQATNRVICG